MQSGNTQRRVLVFIRAPELGKVKTRLEKKMDAVTVLGLYQCFVEDIIQTLTSGGYDITVYFAPSHKESAVQAWLGSTIHIQAQTGRRLGEKMRNAFSDVFATEVDQVVLIGSDFPDLDIRIIHEAFAFLQKKDVAIAPAEDGGYYLMGFRKDTFDGDVFTGIDWGTEHVYRQTLQRIRDASLNDHILPSWKDIDTYEDLTTFYHRSKANGLMHLKTMQFLSRLKLKGLR
jgi:rSAM/selenodomain-associated transferase 1